MIFLLEKIGESAKIRKIAITGTVSAGKSTVCEFLKARGAYVLKADDIVHNLLSNDILVVQKIKEMFGDNVISEGRVERKLLGDQVFSDPLKLKALEDLLHPIVVNTIQESYRFMKDSPDYTAFAVEFPLLFEVGLDPWFDTIIYVKADQALRKKRTEISHFESRLARFGDEASKIAKSHYIIENNGSFENLNKQIENIL